MSRLNRSVIARALLISSTSLALLGGFGLFFSIGGCPGNSSSEALILGNVAEVSVAETDKREPTVQDENVATMENSAVTVTLRGNSPENRALKFAILSNPEHGTLDSIEIVDTTSATVRFAPEPGYAGASSFIYHAWDGVHHSAPATVSIRVYPEVRFSVTPHEAADGLAVTALAIPANPKYPLPDGAYAWAFDDQAFSGPASSNAQRTHTFTSGDMHTVSLTLTLAGIVLPIPCRAFVDPSRSDVITSTNGYIVTVQSSQRRHLIRAGDSWRYLKGLAGAPPAGWSQPAFNDLAWPSGPTGIGYGDNDDATVLSDMYDSYLTVYTRRTFTVQNPATITALTLSIVYDDGFVAYLNGVEVARRNLGAPGAPVTRETEAETSVEPAAPEEISVSPASLVAGTNLLAIEIHNSALGSSDLSLIPELLVGEPQTPPTIAVTGTIRDGNGLPIPGVTLTITGQPNLTNTADGSFNIPLPAGWSGSVTPSKAGFSFIPVGRMYTNLSSLQSGQDFTGSSLGSGQFVISGTISSSGGAPISGATVEFSGLGTAITGPDGLYTKAVRAGWFGRVTPSVSGYSFGPESRSYVAVHADQTTQNYAGTAVTGPAISGVVAMPPTFGARPMIGPVSLRFDGSNGNPNYFVTSAVDGTFSTIVNSGWTGTIAAADPTRCLLFPETTTISTPVTAPLSGQNVQAWVAPIGVPMPGFGLREQAPPLPNPWNGTVAGWYYVDNTHGQATDTNNPNGHPGLPRRTIPRTLAAGSVVEVRGGPYVGFGYVHWSGTAQQPIFVRGSGAPRFTGELALYNDGGGAGATYTIVEGLNVFSLSIDRPCHHVTVRNCEVRGDLTDGGLTVVSYGTDPVTDIVLYNNLIHENGNFEAHFDQDIHGIEITRKAVNIWVLDNEMFHNSGDGIQINGGSSSFSNFHHIYVGRNRAHHNKQTGFWSKQAADVVFSENVAYAHRPGDSSYGAGMGFQYSPANVWFLFNDIYDCEVGFGVSADADVINEGHYFVGNLLRNIHTTSQFNPNDAYHLGQAFAMWGYGTKYIVHNTIHDTDGGIGFAAGPSCIIVDNIISGMRTGTRQIVIGSPQTAVSSAMSHNLLGGGVSIAWGGTVYSSLATFQAATGRGVGCSNADPLFVSSSGGDFHLQAGSSGVNSAAGVNVYATFLQRYGLDIYVDRDHRPRLLGPAHDMGCYER